jgi:putative transposase
MSRVRPSVVKKQALESLLNGEVGAGSENCLSHLVRLSVEKTLQEFLEVEQDQYLGRGRYQRGGTPGVYRNGYESARLKTGEGVVEVRKPQVRGDEQTYRSELWERLNTTSEQLSKLITEMYALGLSNRDVENALSQSLGGFIVGRSEVSEITEELYKGYEKFKQRDLSGFDVVYLFIDTVYEPLRRYGSSTGVMCCWAYLTDGSKVLIDLTTANAESYEACMDFLRCMIKRGLRTPLTVTTDGAAGLIKAVEAIWPRSKRVRCWFHKMQNLQCKVPKEAWGEFKSLVADVRDAPDPEEAKLRAERIVKRYEREFPEACRCLIDDIDASLNHLIVPPRHRQYVRTTNLVERSFVEERRRTKTIPHIWDEHSLLKLVFGTLIRVSDRWAQPSFSTFEEHMIKQLRNELLDEHESVEAQRTPRTRRSHVRAA